MELQHILGPEILRARTRVRVDAAPRTGVVLLWMRVAVRDHENPALDLAIHAANALGTTVLVYHAVSERYPFASDRHHTFILEGARDVARGLRRRGVAYALHVEREGARGPFLRMLAERAALVVTEDAPFPPLSGWTSALARHLAAEPIPFVTVDASCVVPMPRIAERHDRAFAFRAASRALADEALARPWPDVTPIAAPVLPALPFEPVDAEGLDDRAIARLVAACRIDHGVGPVRTVRGGSEAGYARWEAFRAAGLARYAADRNDAAIDGTSRLSPWLHYGHVAPLRIAREAAARPRGPGAEKFLDELLVWREVAWHYAAHTPELDALDALPAWARATLADHADDPRTPIPLERLERGRTGDPLWDLAQRSLVNLGELHNNVRMTWGKAIPAWTPTPEAARRTLVELNHRYALDGRDPASYGGLYGCLGLFDRPFPPARPVLGTVRGRPTDAHARRLDLAAFAARVARPGRAPGEVAVIGAGIAGLTCARTLLDHGVAVTVFDKGRTPGGRLVTHRFDDAAADIGAPFFTVRDPRFERFVRSWMDEGVVARWHGRVGALPAGAAAPVALEPVERFVGTPGMSAVARHLGRDVPVRTSHRVDGLEPRDGRLALRGVVGAPGVTLGPADPALGLTLEPLGVFDAVVVCLPSDQAAALVRGASGALADAAGAAPSAPCIVLGFVPEGDALGDLRFDGLQLGQDGDPDRVLAWLGREAGKPQRRGPDAWVLHADPRWSAAHLRDPREALEAALLGELGRRLGLPALSARATVLRRWAHARGGTAGVAEAWFDDTLRLGVGGDWLAGGGVEGAFLSGIALAGRILGLPG